MTTPLPRSTLDLDAVSLTQALKDFETANARVIDLTQRLLRAEHDRKMLANEVEHLRLRLSRVEAEARNRGPQVLVRDFADRVRRRLVGGGS